MTGYLVFAGCSVLLIMICLGHRRGIDPHSIESMVFGDRKAGSLRLTFSILAAWMWTTSVFGSAETYALYGMWGPISYVVGACIAFAGLIAVLAFLREHYAQTITFVEFVQVRYGRWAKPWFYLFTIIAPAYVLVEQGAGIAYILETFYGSSFRIISFFSIIVATAFVFIGGMRSVLTEEIIAASVIIAGFLLGAGYVIAGGGISSAGEHVSAAGSPGLVAGITTAAVKYFILAIVIAFGQIAFDPAYYIKANLARSTRQMSWSYILGGIVLWGAITLMASLYMGKAAVISGSDVAEMFSGPAKAVFSIIIIMIGISTISHFMIGFLGVFSTDLYTTVVRPDGSDREKIVFGRIMMIAVGISCASITIALENISLLAIDVFCGIFFAAPCVPLVYGLVSQRNFGKLPVISMITGTIAGLVIWLAMPGGLQQGQFAGVAASIMITVLIMSIGLVKRMPYYR